MADPPAPQQGDAAGEPQARYHPAYGPGRSSALISVDVPQAAKVFVNDASTTSTGLHRRYVSRGLVQGRSYTFRVRAEWQTDEGLVSRTEVLKLNAGSSASLDFNQPAEQDDSQVAEKQSETKLTLHVPDDAEVYLAGRRTRMEGTVRAYTTKRLASGETWNDYVVRVDVSRDGHTVSKRHVLDLRGGQSHELTFDFDAADSADQVAAVAR